MAGMRRAALSGTLILTADGQLADLPSAIILVADARRAPLPDDATKSTHDKMLAETASSLFTRTAREQPPPGSTDVELCPRAAGIDCLGLAVGNGGDHHALTERLHSARIPMASPGNTGSHLGVARNLQVAERVDVQIRC